jgi:hypothetical protein
MVTKEAQRRYNQKRKDNPKFKAQKLESSRRLNATPKGRYRVFKFQSLNTRKISFTLTLEEYEKIIVEPCYYCAYELGEPVKIAGGLDRIDNSKGYEPGNVVSCCAACNIMRGDNLTPEETRIAAQAIIAYRKKDNV